MGVWSKLLTKFFLQKFDDRGEWGLKILVFLCDVIYEWPQGRSKKSLGTPLKSFELQREHSSKFLEGCPDPSGYAPEWPLWIFGSLDELGCSE